MWNFNKDLLSKYTPQRTCFNVEWLYRANKPLSLNTAICAANDWSTETKKNKSGIKRTHLIIIIINNKLLCSDIFMNSMKC